MTQSELEKHEQSPQRIRELFSIQVRYLYYHPDKEINEANDFINQHMVAQNSTGIPIWDNPYSAMLFVGGRKAISVKGQDEWRITDNSEHLLVGEIIPFYDSRNEDRRIIGYGARKYGKPIPKTTFTT